MEFDLTAALDSKKPHGTGQVGDHKHSAPKAQGASADKPRGHGHRSSDSSSSSGSSSDSDHDGKVGPPPALR